MFNPIQRAACGFTQISAVLDIDDANSELSCFPLSKLLFQRWIKNPFVCVAGSSLGDGYSLNPGRSFGWGFLFWKLKAKVSI